jgi:hypothetical protein
VFVLISTGSSRDITRFPHSSAHDSTERAERQERDTHTKIKINRVEIEELKTSIVDARAQLRSKAAEKAAFVKQVDADIHQIQREV